jgi:hypothetical protein
MKNKYPILFACGGAIGVACLAIPGSAGSLDSFITGLTMILSIFTFAIALPLASIADLLVRRRKTALIRSLAWADPWTQDAVLEELDPETRTECLRRLGQHGR